MSDSKKQLLKLVIEMFPIVVFFYTYDSAHRESIFLATKAFMASMALSLILSKIIFKKIGLILWISGGLVGVMGSATLYFQNDLFIKLKPTILYSFFALSLLGGMFYKKYFLKNIFGSGFPPLPDAAWRTLTLRFGIFYIFNAILNEIIYRNFSMETWIATKIWLF
ncbi:MAG: septation protein A, partial [Alphaproteobacteria bacterium]|nr:septation protein A [Alphaproteobacteria bacterium]